MGRRGRGLLVGVLGGVVAALLLAPEPGERTRRRLQERVLGLLRVRVMGRETPSTPPDGELVERVRQTLQERLLFDPGLRIHALAGTVWLRGDLARPELREDLLRVVAATPGVDRVVDELGRDVTSPSPPPPTA